MNNSINPIKQILSPTACKGVGGKELLHVYTFWWLHNKWRLCGGLIRAPDRSLRNDLIPSQGFKPERG